jgi:DNA-binding transcriptional LysR family regulator
LKLSQSAISRQIGALEEQLGVMLFHRHARVVSSSRSRASFSTARRATWRPRSIRPKRCCAPTRTSRRAAQDHATVGFGSTWLTAQMHEFIALYP